MLATERTEVWSGVMIKLGVCFAGLHLQSAGEERVGLKCGETSS